MSGKGVRRSQRLIESRHPKPVYEPLDTSHDDTITTRIMTVLPSLSSQGRIQCTLEDFSVPIEGDQPESLQYKALSYLWGTERRLKTIEVDGKQHQIRANLWDFLHHVRLEYSHSRFWIDALCINQADVAERNHQVKVMGTIYRQAAQVLVWLGYQLKRFDGFLDTALNYYRRLSDKSPMNADFQLLHTVCWEHSWTIKRWLQERLKFFHLEYWSRAWIYQEISLSCDILVMSGSRTVEYDVLEKTLIALPEEDDEDVDRTLLSVKINLFCHRSPQWNNLKPPLHHWDAWGSFYNHRDAHCTDLRDRIYSQLSLIKGGQEFVVDYDEDTYGLFLRTCLFCYEEMFERATPFTSLGCFVMALDLWSECIHEELILRARQSRLYSQLLSSLNNSATTLELPTHAWPSSECHGMQCPDCGKYVMSSVRPAHFNRLCCLKTRGLVCHLSFVQDEDQSSLMYHFSALHGIFEQQKTVQLFSGVRLNLSTCLLLAQQKIYDEGVLERFAVNRAHLEKQASAGHTTFSKVSKCHEGYTSQKVEVLEFSSNYVQDSAGALGNNARIMCIH